MAQKKDFLGYVRAEIARRFIFPWHFDPYLHLYLNQETSLKLLKDWFRRAVEIKEGIYSFLPQTPSSPYE
jgi:hypothetical protein